MADAWRTTRPACPGTRITQVLLGTAKRPTVECSILRTLNFDLTTIKAISPSARGAGTHGVCFLSQETPLLNWYWNLCIHMDEGKTEHVELELLVAVAGTKDLCLQYMVFGRLSTALWPPGVLGRASTTQTYSGSSKNVLLCPSVPYFYFCSW